MVEKVPMTQSGFVKLLPNVLAGANMVTVSRADEISRSRLQPFDEQFKIRVGLVGVILRRQAKFSGFGGDFVTMLVSTRLKTDLPTILPLVARPNVRDQIVERIAYMWRAVDIRNRRRDV